jgi:hypothetical protein
MDRKIEEISRKLGAEVIGTVPDNSAGAFGVAKLARTLRERLEPAAASGPVECPALEQALEDPAR